MSAKILGSSGVLYNERRDFYISPNVVKELWSDVTPFTTVIANKETRSGLADPLFKMFEHRNPWVKQQFTGSYVESTPAVGTAIVLTSLAGVEGLEAVVSGTSLPDSYKGLQVEWTHGSIRIVGIITSTANVGSGAAKVTPITLTGSSSAAAVSAGTFSVVGNAHGEGTYSPEAWADELSIVYNSCQIFKTPVEITGSLYEAALRGEKNELSRLRKQKNQVHKIQKERAFLFGGSPKGTGMASGESFAESNIVDADGKVIRSTMGIVTALEKYGTTSGDSQNVFASTELDTYSEFVDAMEKVFQYVPTSGMKRAFVGSGALGYWSKLNQDSGFGSGWTVNLGDMKRDRLGFNYRVLETPHGMLQLIPTPALRGSYNKKMLVVDDGNLFHAQYRKPKFQANIKTDNAYDGVKDQYFSDEGIGISLIEAHSLMTTPDNPVV